MTVIPNRGRLQQHSAPLLSKVGSSLSAKQINFFLGVFTLTLAPFAYFEISKTKLLQMFTTVMRYATFFMLMSLCIVGVAHPDPFAGG